MKRTSFGLANLGVALGLLMLCGCETSMPGVTKSMMGAYDTVLDGAPDPVTAAAVQTFNELHLTGVVSQSSKIDGSIAAKTAQGDDVKMSVNQAETNSNVSKIEVKVGSWGDEGVSLEIIKRIQFKLKHPGNSDSGPGPEPMQTESAPH